jgi:hypothetical protein
MSDPVETSLNELKNVRFSELKRGDRISLFETDFPESLIWCDGKNVLVEITEHIYTKYWQHKFPAHVFVEAMLRAIKRLRSEGHPFTLGKVDNDDEPHFFVRWKVIFPKAIDARQLIRNTRIAFDLVWERANNILENSDSILLLGKDTGNSLKLLKHIQRELEFSGYSVYIVKEQPDRRGESIIQKVQRYALSSKFVIVENSEPSGHLYEIPHVAKMLECITVFLEEKGRGATWMFEDIYGKSKHLRKFVYTKNTFQAELKKAVNWAEQFSKQFALFQKNVLPWMK